MILPAVACVWLASADAGQVATPPAAESSRYVVSLASIGSAEPGLGAVTLAVHDSQTGRQRTLSFSNRTVRVNRLVFAGDSRLLVLGKLGSGGDVVTILDLERDVVIDTIWAWQFSLCPELDIAVYRFRYPPASMAAYDSHVVLAYDLAAPPSENSRTARVANLMPEERRGYVLYPEANRLSGRAFIPAADPGQRRRVNSPFACCASRREIAFVEFYREKTYLVRINVAKGLDTPVVHRTEITPERFTFRRGAGADGRWKKEGISVDSLEYQPGCRALKLTIQETDSVAGDAFVVPLGKDNDDDQEAGHAMLDRAAEDCGCVAY